MKTKAFVALFLTIAFFAMVGEANAASIPIRDLKLDTQDKTIFLTEEMGDRDGYLTESVDGVEKQQWKVKYEHKGSSRRICEPPVLNISFDKKDSRGKAKPLFNGRTTVPGYSSVLTYQKIRLIPECDLWNDYGQWASDVGFNGTSNVLLREYLIHDLFRHFGIPTPDVIGFARMHFVSSDPKYNGKEFRYLIIQRVDEFDDPLPFIKQFNLSPQLYVSGQSSRWQGYIDDENDNTYYTSRLVNIDLQNFDTGEKVKLPLDQKEAITMSLMTDFFNLGDMGVIHNEDYGMDLKTKKYYIIPHGFDASFSCEIKEPSLNYIINHIPQRLHADYKARYYTTAREIFANPASLDRMLSAVDAYPFNDDKEKIREFLKLSFYQYSSHFTSESFAKQTGQAYVPTEIKMPFSSDEEYQRHFNAFDKSCQRTFVPLDKNMVIVTGTPKLEKIPAPEYGEAREKLQAFFNVKITTGNEELKVLKQQAFTVKLEGSLDKPKPNNIDAMFGDYNLWPSYPRPDNLEDSIGPYYYIPPNTSVVFEVIAEGAYEPIEKDTYKAVLVSFKPFASAIQMTSIANNKTNSLVFGGIERIEEVKSISLLTPVFDEVIEKGKPYTIKYGSSGVLKLKIDLMDSKGIKIVREISTTEAQRCPRGFQCKVLDQEYYWNVPSDLDTERDNYFIIRISSSDDPKISVKSDKFRISEKNEPTIETIKSNLSIEYDKNNKESSLVSVTKVKVTAHKDADLVIPENYSNSAVIIGETSPYIEMISSNPSPPSADTVVMAIGKRFGSGMLDVYVNEKKISLSLKKFGQYDAVSFTPKELGIGDGWVFVQISHPTEGKSNFYSFEVFPIKPPQAASIMDAIKSIFKSK